ncbi:MAG: DUF134 domain-containing protein [Oscillospiraceae bacterium]|nr:DUF134 domain-containing protein [Oscillospiraceae bacterium]MBQ8670128.1 DUF134 domain-containing protein [Oscillospiraceae bacterium]MBQ9109533.1 DUF134 domain-containing protein [Oscillospiraceae bacterium]
MPRPCKRRTVCSMPGVCRFGPSGQQPGHSQPVEMQVDEYECIRLIDLEGLNQEECAQRMGVARTTAQAIYNSARTKLAACLVEGRELVIQGGQYTLCQGEGHDRGCSRCGGGGCPHHQKGEGRCHER